MSRLLKYVIGVLGIALVALVIGVLLKGEKRPARNVVTTVSQEKVVEAVHLDILGFEVSDSLTYFRFNVEGLYGVIPPLNKIISKKIAKKCFKTSLGLSGIWKWVKYNSLIFIPDTAHVIPDEVNFYFDCVPVDTNHYLKVQNPELHWQFEPISHVKIGYEGTEKAKIVLFFSLPVRDTAGAYRLIKVKGYQKVSRVWEKANRLVILVDLSGDTIIPITVVLKSGLRFIGNLELKKDYSKSVKVGKVIGELAVRYVRFHKGDEGGYLECSFGAPGGYKVTLSKDVKDYITFSPQIDFTTGVIGSKVYIYGDFDGGRRYTLVIKSGLRSKEGFVLKRDYKRSFDVPIPDAKLKFLSRGLYLGRGAAVKVPFSMRRIDRLYLDIEWMPPSHIPFYYFAGNASTYRFSKFARKIVNREELPFKNTGYKDKVEFIDLPQYISLNDKGLYKIKLSGKVSGEEYERYVSTEMVVAITDLAIISKYSDSLLYVWVFDVKTLTPIDGAVVKAMSGSGFVIGTGTTNASGVCIIKSHGDLEPYIVTAQKGNNWSFIGLDETSVDLSSFDINGLPQRKPYSAMLYFERDLYRPGDTIFYNLIVRKSKSYSGVSLPIRIKIKDPRGKQVADISGITDKAGYFGGAYPTQLVFPTGRYAFEAYIGGELYTVNSVNVETFVPERIALEIKVPSRVYGEKFKVNISAMYLVGTPCAQFPYTLRIYEKPIRYISKRYPMYEFGVPVQNSYRKEVGEFKGKLDRKGKKEIEVDLGKYIKNKLDNPYQIDIQASVWEEESGRSTERIKSTTIYNASYYVGIRSNKKRYRKGEDVHIDGIIVTPYDTILKSEKFVKLVLYKLEYYYSYWYDDYYESDELRWDRYTTMLPVMEVDSLPVDEGKFSYSFVYPSYWEDYVVEVITPSGVKARKRLMSDWWWGEGQSGVKPAPPEVLNIELSSDTADENEYVTAKVKLPFEGWVLWSIELDSVYESKWERADGKIAEWTFRVPEGIPNVYVSCLLVRNKGDYMLKRGIGIKRLKILPKRLLLDVSLNAPSEVKPGENINITLRSDEDFEATVAVVDEGVLGITGFKTPDPLKGILRDIKLLLKTSETFGWFRPRYLKTGGGFRGREEPVQPKFFTTVTYFSGLRKSKSGVIKLKVPVGNYQGKVRIMVNAFNAGKMAKKEKDVVVKSDVIVYVTMPRFLYSGDTFYLPITLMNTTKRDMSIDFNIKARGITLMNTIKKVRLKALDRKSIMLVSYADSLEKSAELKLTAKYSGGMFKDSFNIPVYPDKPYVTDVKTYRVTPLNGVVYLDSMVSGYLKNQHHVSIYATYNVYLRGLYAAREVIGYPYGCVEQTSSKLYMLYAFSPFIELFKDIVPPDRLSNFIEAGISRLITMQTWDGGFSFWPGEGVADPGYSGYATLVLELAKESGYYVPDGVLELAYSYLETNGKNIALSLYALARAGRLNKIPGGIESALKIYRNSVYVPDRLWAILAIYESGKADLARRLFGELLRREKVFKSYWLPLYYIYRERLFDEGLKLYVAEHIEFDRRVVDSLAQKVNQALIEKEYRYHSTQSLVWSLLGLSEYSKRFELKDLKLKLYVNGKSYPPRKMQGLLYFYLHNPDIRDIYLKGPQEGSYYVIVQNTGFKVGAKFKKEASDLHVKRELFTYDGKRLKDTVVKPGDLVVMRISWYTPVWVQNVAIEAPIPAGMDIENPRLAKESVPLWARSSSIRANPDYVDIRDDRIIIFDESSRRSREYFVLLRVNLKGNYFLSPVRGVVMYRPTMHYNGMAERISIP